MSIGDSLQAKQSITKEEIKILDKFGVKPKNVFNVSYVVINIKKIIDSLELLPNIGIRGEILNILEYNNHTYYFDLKDPEIDIKINCSIAKNTLPENITLENGLDVVVIGQIKLTERYGQLMVYCQQMALIGEGYYQLMRKQIYERLNKEKLFEESRKKRIPYMCHNLGVISSENADGFFDLIGSLMKRLPHINLSFYNAPMMGEHAPKEISEALSILDKTNLDVIAIVRGGGSTDSLHCFDNEQLCRSIANCKTPIITGLGHKKDLTLVDLVADKYAHTPSKVADEILLAKEDILIDVDSFRTKALEVYTNRLAYFIAITVKKKDNILRSFERIKHTFDNKFIQFSGITKNDAIQLINRSTSFFKTYDNKLKLFSGSNKNNASEILKQHKSFSKTYKNQMLVKTKKLENISKELKMKRKTIKATHRMKLKTLETPKKLRDLETFKKIAIIIILVLIILLFVGVIL